MPILPSDFARYLPTNNVALLQGIGMNQNYEMNSVPQLGDLRAAMWDLATEAA